jgi:hypothetical protein
LREGTFRVYGYGQVGLDLAGKEWVMQDLANVEMANKIEKDVLIVIMYNTLKCL